jgi:hypothetical protein
MPWMVDTTSLALGLAEAARQLAAKRRSHSR